MAKRYYNLEKETKAFLKRMDETRGVLPDSAGIARINDYIVRRKGLGLFFGIRDKSCLNVNSASQQRISITSNNSLRVSPSWEMVAWVFPKSSLSLAELISKGTNNPSNFEFSLRQSSLNVSLGSSTGTTYLQTGNKTLSLNIWNFYNFGRDNSTGNLFLSRNADTSPTTVAQSPQAIGGASFVIGDWADASRPANAIFDGIGRWGRVLTTDERNFIYNSGRGVSYLELLTYRPDILVGCVSYWQLNESSGTRYDWHGTNHMSPINNPLNSNIGIIEKFY
jgi:hypothetical protein